MTHTGSPPPEENQGETKVSLQKLAADFLQSQSPWARGIHVALRRYLYVAVPVLFWCVLLLFEAYFPEAMVLGITLGVVTVLFVLSIPVGLLHRLDLLLADVSSYSGNSKAIALVVILLFVLVNFVVIGAVGGFIKGLRGR